MDKHTFKKMFELAGTIGLSTYICWDKGAEVCLFLIFTELIIHWLLPYSIGQLIYRDEREDYDGELGLKLYDDGDADYILTFYHTEDIPSHDELRIFVSEEVKEIGIKE